MFEDFADSLGPPDFCSAETVSEARIWQAFEEPSQAYGIFHEMVARVHQDYGPEAFDMLWAASAADPSDEALLAAFEAVLGTTLFELMQRPSATCRARFAGCAGLEEYSLTSNALTVTVPRSCDEGTSGLEPGNIYRSFVLELEQPGDLTVSFDGANGFVNVGACDGFEDLYRYGNYTARDYELGGAWRVFPLDAGVYRVVVVGRSDGPAAEARFELTPNG